MSTLKVRVLLLAVICFLGFVSPSIGQEDETIDVKDLPKAVLDTIKKRYPKAELTEARKTFEESVVIYEVDLANDKTLIEIGVFANGKIDWVAVDLPVTELPKPVVAGIKKKYPAATLNHASTVYTVKNGKDQLEHYYVEIETKKGKKRGLDVLPKGMIEADDELDDE